MASKRDTLGQMIAVDLTALADRSDDPERALRDYVTRAHSGRAEVLEELTQARAELLLLRERRGPSQAEAARHGAEAERAVQAGDDDAAREALRRQRAAERTAAEWERQVTAQDAAVRHLGDASRRLAEKIAEAELRLSSLVSRHKAAQAAVRVEKVLQQAGVTDDELGALWVIEAAISEEEATAAAMTEVAAQHAEVSRRLHDQTEDAEVEARLAELKQRLGQ